MNIIITTTLTTCQKRDIYDLWNNEYPASIGYTAMQDFDTYLANLTDQRHYLLLTDNRVKGWMFTFVRNEGRWFAIILDSLLHGQGYGSQLISRLKEDTDKLCGWVMDHDKGVKTDGSPYRSPLAFYMKNGFTVCPEVRLETEKISTVKIQWQR